MIRKLLLLLVIFAGASASWPPLRERVAPVAAPIWADALAALMPLVEPRLEPVRRWSARREMRQVARTLYQQDVARVALPTPQQFPAYVRRLAISSRGVNDPWGAPYQLVVRRDSIIIVSAGPDRVRGSADDLREGVARR